MNRRSSYQVSARQGRPVASGAWKVAVVASIAAWIGACLAPDAQQGKTPGATASSGGTPGATGSGAGAGGGGQGGAGGGGGASSLVSAVWLNPYGNGSVQSARVMTADAEGNAIVAGVYAYEEIMTGGMMLPAANEEDTFVAKLSPDGAVLWSRNIGGAGNQTVNGVAVDPKDGSIVLAGGFTQSLDTKECDVLASAGGTDVFVVKLDPTTGACAWSRAFGDGADQLALGLAVGEDQGAVLTGTFAGTLDFGGATMPLVPNAGPAVNGNTEIFVAKLDQAGQALLSRTIGDPPYDLNQASLGIAVDSSNDVLITGTFEGALLVTGEPIFNEGPPDLFLGKLTGSSLLSQWCLTSGDGASHQYSRSVAVGPSKNIVFAGFYTGDVKLGDKVIEAGPDVDIFVAAVSPDGQPLWGKRVGGIGAQYALDVALDSDQSILLSGAFSGVLDFSDAGGGDDPLVGSDVMAGTSVDAFVARLSPEGDRIWSFQGRGPDSQSARAVAPAPNGAYVAGWFQNMATFGTLPASSLGQEDIYILKLED
jgi:hypothetical protein